MSSILKKMSDKGIITITINRPESLNAINQEVMQGLHRFFSEGYKRYVNMCGVIITGSGNKAFVAGADIKEFSGFDAAKGTALSKYGHDTYFLIERFHVPVVAAVNGFALGGGCELAMACHMRIASEKAKFGQPEVNLGLVPGYGGTQRLIQLIGKGKAIEFLLTADMIGADEALALGLVNHVVPVGTELEMSEKLLLKIAAKGPIAVKKVIECVNAHFAGQESAFIKETEDFGYTIATEDCQEGSRAFVEKRKANFKGK
jgi:enoyl-CoA hydratase